MMKFKNLLVVSVGVGALLQSATPSFAEIACFTNKSIDEDGMSFISITPRSKDIGYAARMASAAYNDKDLVGFRGRHSLRDQKGFEERAELIQEGHDLVSFHATMPGQGHIPAGMVTYKDGTLTISYHGSECVEDFTEANLGIRRLPMDKLGLKGSAHNGFYSRYMQSREAMLSVAEDMLQRHGKTMNDVEVLVTGHSLGGALSTLAAADLKEQFKDARLNLITFSSPRVFDDIGARKFNALIGKENAIRVWRDMDIVPAALLGTILGYKHVGQSVKLEATTWYPSLTNHSLESIKKDAISPKTITSLAHEGYRTWMKRKVMDVQYTTKNAVASVAKAPFNMAKSIGSWFTKSQNNTPISTPGA